MKNNNNDSNDNNYNNDNNDNKDDNWEAIHHRCDSVSSPDFVRQSGGVRQVVLTNTHYKHDDHSDTQDGHGDKRWSRWSDEYYDFDYKDVGYMDG